MCARASWLPGHPPAPGRLRFRFKVVSNVCQSHKFMATCRRGRGGAGGNLWLTLRATLRIVGVRMAVSLLHYPAGARQGYRPAVSSHSLTSARLARGTIAHVQPPVQPKEPHPCAPSQPFTA
jgi:hypothetical protein